MHIIYVQFIYKYNYTPLICRHDILREFVIKFVIILKKKYKQKKLLEIILMMFQEDKKQLLWRSLVLFSC